MLLSCVNKEEQRRASLAITDDLGNVFEFGTAPARIITLAPSLTEIIYDLGVEKYLTGNTFYCDYPEAARKIEKVGDMLTFNFEKIVTLKPDLVFITVEGNTKETYDKFRELGIKIFVSNPRSFEGIKKTYLDFGKIFGLEKEAKLKIAAWDSTVSRIKSSLSSHQQQKTAMFLIELRPVMLAGKNTFINEYLEICGLKNIAEDSPLNYPVYSREEILRKDPDFIIYPGVDEEFPKIKNSYSEWSSLKAIQRKEIIFVDRNLYLRPGPRFVEAVTDLFTRLHQK